MRKPGIKLTTYFQERDRCGDRFLADALFDVYERREMRTSVLLRGVQGFGHRQRLQTDRLLTLSESLPAVSIAVDTPELIAGAITDVLEVARHGLISLERTELVTGGELDGAELPRWRGAAVKLTIYGGRSVRSGGQPGYVAAVQRLREAGAVGASVLLGVDGTLHGERRRARFFARNAGLPLVLLAIGEANALESVLPDLTKLIEDPVVTIERVQVHKPDERQISGPEQIPDHDQAGLSLWQKVMVHTEEQAKCAGRPLHVELVRRLHEAGAAGVTVLRGVRGFYGERGPFADHLLTLRRNVPVHVIAVDTPTNVRRWWPLVSETTRDGGLVTVERVPAAHALTSGQPGELRLAAPDTAQAPGG